jgi:hypothetical protein
LGRWTCNVARAANCEGLTEVVAAGDALDVTDKDPLPLEVGVKDSCTNGLGVIVPVLAAVESAGLAEGDTDIEYDCTGLADDWIDHDAEMDGDTVLDTDDEREPENDAEVDGDGDGEGEVDEVGRGAHHNAYTLLSLDPTYTVPSSPIAGDEYTWLPV